MSIRKFLQGQFNRSVLIPGIAFKAVIIAFVNPSVSLLVYMSFRLQGTSCKGIVD